MAELPSHLISEDLASSLVFVQDVLDASLNGMVVYEAIRGAEPDGPITDLRLALLNRVAADDPNRPLFQLEDQPIKAATPTLADSPLYDRLIRVITTGLPERFTLALATPLSNELRQFDLSLTRIANLVVVSYNDLTDRLRAEQASQQQIDRLRFVTDNAVTAIVLYSIVRDPGSGAVVDLRYELVNRMAEQLVRRTEADLAGKTMRQAFPGIDQTPIWGAYMKLAETGEPLRLHNHYTQHQLDIWYEVQGIREQDHLVLSFLDITELKRAQEHIEWQNNEFRQVLDNALTAISHLTSVREETVSGKPGKIIDFVFQSFNRASEQFTGKRAEDVIGKRLLDVFPDRRTNGLFARWVDLVESQGSTRFQNQREDSDAWFDTQAIAWNDGFIQSYLDITPIKQAELEQQRQREMINRLLAASPVLFIHFNAIRDSNRQITDFEVVQANQTAADSLGYPLHELTGKRLTSLSPTITNGPFFARYVRVVETGEPAHFERQHGDKWYQMSLVHFDEGLICSAVDVTESRLYRQQLEAMNQELLRSNDSLQQFAYVASHDLQEPLRKIQSFSHLLDEQYGPQLDTFGQDAIVRMQSAATRMSMLITDLLTYSRISANRQPFQPVDLDVVLNEALTDLEVAVQETRATIDRTPLPTIAGDPTQLRQLFQNLLSNALKFQPPPDEATDHPRIQIDCEQELIDGRVWYDITVSDNGIGFDPKYVDRIFQVFQRLHGKQSYAGTGVGLAICKRVVETHGGTLTARSQPGQGAAFLIRIPG